MHGIIWILLFLSPATIFSVTVRNSALNKPAIQSSTFRENQELFGSRLANDESSLTCAKTQWSWTLFWRVDLKEMLPVVGANLTLRWEYFGSSSNKFLYRIDLQIGEENIPFTDSCGSKTIFLDRPDDYKMEINCMNRTVGRFVTLNIVPNYAGSVTTGSPQLTLCDVKVFTVLPSPTNNMSVALVSSADNEIVAAASSHHTEMILAEDDPTRLLFLSEIPETTDEPNITIPATPDSPTPATPASPRRRIFKERKTKLERLIKQMQPRASEEDVDNLLAFDTRHTVTGSFSSELAEVKGEIVEKIQAMHGYVVFSGIAIGILLLLALLLGFLMLWSLTCKNSDSKDTSPEAIHEFSFKAPSPLPDMRTLDRANFLRVTEFPRGTVPKSRVSCWTN